MCNDCQDHESVNMGILLQSLPKSLQNEISEVCRKKYFYLKELGLDANLLFHDRHMLGRKIYKLISSGKYQHQILKRSIMNEGTKERIVYKLGFIDRVISGACQKIIAVQIDDHYQNGLYSYRKNYNRMNSVNDFLKYLKDYKSKTPDIRQRGLYVMRFDIKDYGACVPVHQDSALWPQYKNIFAHDCYGKGFDADDFTLIRKFIDPDILTDAGLAPNRNGVVIGSPLTVLILNLYLRPLDEYLYNIPDTFYTRFGDDMIFVTPDLNTLKETQVKISEILSGLELNYNEAKAMLINFNNAGRMAGGIKGAHKFEYLGVSIGFDGQIEIKTQKLADLMKVLKKRLRIVSSSCENIGITDVDIKGRAIAQDLNNGFNIKSPFFISQLEILSLINSKKQLMHIDYTLALMIAETLSGIKGVRAFRQIPYRRIRAWGLQSLAYKSRTRLAS